MGSMSNPDFNKVTDWSFALLTMRVHTPGGEWLADDFERFYQHGWAELEGDLGESAASEMAILELANMGMHLVDYLVQVTGQPASIWLERLRQDYVEQDRQEGES